MNELCFILNDDRFFHTHRLSLVERLSKLYDITILAGDSGFSSNYYVHKFSVKSRIPTPFGIAQLFQKVSLLDRDIPLVVVTPVMIVVCHFLFLRRQLMIYNFSGLGFLRANRLVRSTLFFLMRIMPVSGKRVFVVQNNDDLMLLKNCFIRNDSFFFEIIPGSGFVNDLNFCRVPNLPVVTFGYVGRIRKDKGVLDLIKAVTDLRAEGQNLNLVIWGELDTRGYHGFTKDELEFINSNSLFLKGFSEDKLNVFRSFNWFCLPSNGEGLSRAAIEACSFGKPLLMSNVSGNRDMINGNGFYYEYGDVSGLKDVIRVILNLPTEQARLMSERSYMMYKTNWTLDLIVDLWFDLLLRYRSIE